MIGLASVGFLIGTWNCTYTAGSQSSTYTATFSYDVAKNWIRERDAASGSDVGIAYLTRDPKQPGWTYSVLGSDRTVTIFRAGGDSAAHIVYRSVYPTTGMTDTFDQVSPTKFTLHFSGVYDGKQMTSVDVCTKS